jgi:uncharacterized protein YkwD
MKYLSSKFSYLSKASVFVSKLSAQASITTVCICLLSTLLVACGGSSGSGATTDDGNTTPVPPVPQPGDNASYNLGNTPQVVIDQCMSDVDKEMLTHVNDARSQARNCGNGYYPATTALSWHCTLEDVAYEHSRDMGDHNYFSHTGSDGLAPGDRVRNAGYDWSAVGENIAAGQQSIDTVMTTWLDSPGHCANIMYSLYTEVGAASYPVDGSDYSIYWTQIFARPRI